MNPDQSNDSVETTTTENNSAESHEIKEWGQEETQEPNQTQDETQEPEKKEPEPEKPKKSRAAERLEEVLREKAKLAEKLAAYENKQQTTELKRPDFADFAEFQKAESQYFIDVAKAEMRAELQQQQASQAATAQEAELQTAMDELSDEGVDVDSYFKKAETLPELPVTLDQFGLRV